MVRRAHRRAAAEDQLEALTGGRRTFTEIAHNRYPKSLAKGGDEAYGSITAQSVRPEALEQSSIH